MTRLNPPFRRARKEDDAALAELVNYAGEGMPLYLWTEIAGPDGDPWAVGRERARRERGAFSWRNAVVIEADGKIAAALIGYPLPEEPEPVPVGMPAMFVPMQELENLAPGTWYVNVLAAMPDQRGRGHGAALLALAEDIARDEGCSGLSIIVSDANTGARRLYERTGYREAATRPMVKNGWKNEGQNWVLLVKEL